MPFGKRKNERAVQYHVATVRHLQLVEGPEEAPRDYVSIITDEIEAALRTKRHFRSCLARLLKKDAD